MGQLTIGFGYFGDAAAPADGQPYLVVGVTGFARAVPDYNGPTPTRPPQSDLVACWWPSQQWAGWGWNWNAGFEAW